MVRVKDTLEMISGAIVGVLFAILVGFYLLIFIPVAAVVGIVLYGWNKIMDLIRSDS